MFKVAASTSQKWEGATTFTDYSFVQFVYDVIYYFKINFIFF